MLRNLRSTIGKSCTKTNITCERHYWIRTFDFDKLQRTSPHNPRARELIIAVREKHYDQAIALVKNEKIDVNSHDRGENTALADSCKRADLDDTKFLVEELNASPYVSCDCPAHKTPLHYAVGGSSVNGQDTHWKLVKYFLDGNIDFNVLDKYGKTPIEHATNPEIKKLLEVSKCLKGNLLPDKQQILLALPGKLI